MYGNGFYVLLQVTTFSFMSKILISTFQYLHDCVMAAFSSLG